MKILITGGAGFIGSHLAEHYARERHEVMIYDNLSRARLMRLNGQVKRYQRDYLRQYSNVQFILGDVRNFKSLCQAMTGAQVVIHCAGQTAVTTSILSPRLDFEVNAMGTVNVLEAAARLRKKPTVLFCSTNKVYGKKVDHIPVEKQATRYSFDGICKEGISEDFGVDVCERSPYGCSKLTGDLYMQDYALSHGSRVGIFRMSCVYGTRQFGAEDQGWVAWFTIAALLGKTIVIYGDGRQVRDVLYVSDLVRVFDRFLKSRKQFGVYNIGGGVRNTISLLELVHELEHMLDKKIDLSYRKWRSCDQKVYVSDIRKARRELRWEPKISVTEGVRKLVEWASQNTSLLNQLYLG